MPTIATLPTYPVPNRDVRIVLTRTESGSNFAKVWCTNAPPGSALKKELDESGAGRIELFTTKGGDNDARTKKFDKGGIYVLAAQEYTKGASTHGGSYQDDPNSGQDETAVGSEVSIELVIGNKLTQTVGAGADRGKIVVYVFSDAIRETTVKDHGEKTPAIVQTTSPRAKNAAVAANVLTALAALIDTTASTSIGDPKTILDNIKTRFNTHRASASFHAAADTLNTVASSFQLPNSPKAWAATANELRTKMDFHFRNADPTDASTALTGGTASPFHVVGTAIADLEHLPIVTGATSPSDVYALTCDLWRAYEAHRADTAYHSSADTTALTALPKIADVHRYFLVSIASGSPTAPAVVNSGVVPLINTGGFVEE